MKIAVASLGDPSSVSTWSGIPAHIISALKKRGHEIKPIALQRPEEPWYYSWARRYYHRVEKKWFLGSVEERWLRQISEQLDDEVNHLKPEVVLVIHADWLAYSTFKTPACIIHDTTFASIVNYYPSFCNLSSRSLRMGNEMYRRALDKSVAAIFPATWATKSAIHEYDSPHSKIFTIPFGANLDSAPSKEEVSEWIDERCERDTCNLVFMGTQWNRKGGPDTLRFVRALNEMGVHTKLTIVGCVPDIPADLRTSVFSIGYLKKDSVKDNAKLMSILRRSHALVLLSNAECFGCVYCEANAYALPAIGRDTGGVPEIIKEGINGLLFGRGEEIEDLAARWVRIWRNRDGYKQLCHNSYQEFCERLNYNVFANKLEGILLSLVGNSKKSFVHESAI